MRTYSHEFPKPVVGNCSGVRTREEEEETKRDRSACVAQRWFWLMHKPSDAVLVFLLFLHFGMFIGILGDEKRDLLALVHVLMSGSLSLVLPRERL